MSVISERELKNMIEQLVDPEEIIFEYDNAVFESNIPEKRVKRIYVVKNGRKAVFNTSYPAAVKTIMNMGITINYVKRDE